MAERISVKVRVTGRVQGVGFRAWTAREARRLDLDGWVRNQADGSVLALISGPEAAVARLIAALEMGPPSAQVVSVTTEAVGDAPSAGFRVTG